MPLTAAERAKKYRDRLKQKTAKYLESKREDCARKARKRASMNTKEEEEFLENHRKAQLAYRRKVEGQNTNASNANRCDCPWPLTPPDALYYLGRYAPNTRSPKR